MFFEYYFRKNILNFGPQPAGVLVNLAETVKIKFLISKYPFC